MRIILKIFKWILISLALTAVSATATLMLFICSKEFRQQLFPLEWHWQNVAIKCHDIEVKAADTARLEEIIVAGQGFRLHVPNVELKYFSYPPRLRQAILFSPVLKVKISSKGGAGHLPLRTITQTAKILHIHDGTLLMEWENGKANINHLELAPSEKETACKATADYNISALDAVIAGKAVASLLRDDYRILVQAKGVTAHLPEFRPVRLSADAETSLTRLNHLQGSIRIENTLSLLPPSVTSKAELNKRFVKIGELPSVMDFSLTIPGSAGFNGTIEVPKTLFPPSFAPAKSPVAAYRVALDQGYRSGRFSIELPDLDTTVEGRFQNRGKQGIKWKVGADSDVKNYSFYLDDNHAVEGLSGRIWGEASGVAGKKREAISWSINASWHHGDLLVYPWYFDLSSSASGKFHARGILHDTSIIEVREASLNSLADIHLYQIRIPIQGFPEKFRKDPMNALQNLVAERGDILLSGPIERTYQVMVRDPFEAGHAVLSELWPSGNFKVRLNSLGADISIDADIRWREEEVVNGIKFRGIVPLTGKKCNASVLTWNRISIPAHIAENPNGPIERTPHGEKVQEDGNTAFFMDAGRLDLKTCKDRIIFGELQIPAGNGTITTGSGELLYATRDLTFSDVDIDDVQLSVRINGKPVRMLLSGKKLGVHVKNGMISVNGTLNTKFARGTVNISGIWFEFSGPVPRFGADIEFHGIDIATLTELTDFGRITGILDGRVSNLVISGHQPESFDLEIRSRKSGNQEISIKAIRNLSILGGGGGGIPLLGQFFKNFSYSRIGVSCSLRNDIFSMHGLIREGETEYLVKRGFWGGVNVINQNPGGRISFSDMLERLARITKSGKATVE